MIREEESYDEIINCYHTFSNYYLTSLIKDVSFPIRIQLAFFTPRFSKFY